eukprot:scaffold93828_cov65-Phaeocystis_antarctica.AAC.2
MEAATVRGRGCSRMYTPAALATSHGGLGCLLVHAVHGQHARPGCGGDNQRTWMTSAPSKSRS